MSRCWECYASVDVGLEKCCSVEVLYWKYSVKCYLALPSQCNSVNAVLQSYMGNVVLLYSCIIEVL